LDQFKPHNTILSPSCNLPLDKMTSIVVPRPSITFTSRTVHSNSERYIKSLVIRFWVNFINKCKRSGTPSPVCADAGQRETYLKKFLFSYEKIVFKPCSLKGTIVCWTRSSNSWITCFGWWASVSWIGASGIAFQS
jgi:hypothetical protein